MCTVPRDMVGYIIILFDTPKYVTQTRVLVVNVTPGWPAILAYRLFYMVKILDGSEGDSDACTS